MRTWTDTFSYAEGKLLESTSEELYGYVDRPYSEQDLYLKVADCAKAFKYPYNLEFYDVAYHSRVYNIGNPKLWVGAFVRLKSTVIDNSREVDLVGYSIELEEDMDEVRRSISKEVDLINSFIREQDKKKREDREKSVLNKKMKLKSQALSKLTTEEIEALGVEV